MNLATRARPCPQTRLVPSHLSLDRLDSVQIDPSWTFADKTRGDTNYLTHGYHRYPAKFIPHIAQRLLETYTAPNDTVFDPFAGCGTTLVEAKVLGRKAVGVDINPVACLIAKAKTTALNPSMLNHSLDNLRAQIDHYTPGCVQPPTHARIDYWFEAEQKNKLAFILHHIRQLRQAELRDFYLCAFSNILKGCSIWLQKSNKPTRDFDKIPSEPFVAFSKQAKSMVKAAGKFHTELVNRGHLSVESRIFSADAKHCDMLADNSIDLIVTSPPYVTSYEYADLHQLSALWFEFTQDLADFRQGFVGSASAVANLDSADPAAYIVAALAKQDKKQARSVAGYYADMRKILQESQRVLRRGGLACIVIGDTKLKGVEITNARVFLEYCAGFDMSIEDIIKRQVISKNIPSVRDKVTGRFSRVTAKNKTLVYPTEYILVVRKS